MTKIKTIAILIILTSLLNFSELYSQELHSTEITANLNELFINRDNTYGEIPEKTVELYFNNMPNIYYFDIEYNGKVLFREMIRKTVPQSTNVEIMNNLFRFTYNKIYLDASLISDSDKLKLLESYTNKIVDIAGKKLINLGDFKIVVQDYKEDKYVVNNLLENMHIKIYKVKFK